MLRKFLNSVLATPPAKHLYQPIGLSILARAMGTGDLAKQAGLRAEQGLRQAQRIEKLVIEATERTVTVTYTVVDTTSYMRETKAFSFPRSQEKTGAGNAIWNLFLMHFDAQTASAPIQKVTKRFETGALDPQVITEARALYLCNINTGFKEYRIVMDTHSLTFGDTTHVVVGA